MNVSNLIANSPRASATTQQQSACPRDGKNKPLVDKLIKQATSLLA